MPLTTGGGPRLGCARRTAAAGLLLLLLLAATARGLPRDPAHPADASGTRRDREGSRPRPATLSRVTLWTGCAMVFGTVTEGAMNDWSALYLRDAAGAAPQTAPLGIAAVSVVMLAARLRADTWRARWGDAAVLRAGSTLAAAGLAAALLAGGVVPALAGFACVGLGMAAVTPCCYVAAARQGPRALSLVAAMGTTGLLAGPAAIGFVADARGIAWGMAAVALSALLTALCGTRIPLPAPART
ncbi:hypothetical protein [Streptomyces sp. NPDC090445]|uniref:hypothetical protein n=1 Tax=Streptomyces sp. NPDC090445 TaxID=3365963 RepID=UPI00381EE265